MKWTSDIMKTAKVRSAEVGRPTKLHCYERLWPSYKPATQHESATLLALHSSSIVDNPQRCPAWLCVTLPLCREGRGGERRETIVAARMPGQCIGVVLVDLVSGRKHAHGGGHIATSTLGLVHNRLEEAAAIHIRPVPGVRQLWLGPKGAPGLQKAPVGLQLCTVLSQHLPDAILALDASIAVHLQHGQASPLLHRSRTPSQ